MTDKKNKILLVDDDPFLVRMYQTKFVNDGYEVKIAFNGEDGLNMAQSEKPDIILLDVMIPKIDGFEALKRLKSNPETKNIPVFLLTNLGGEQVDTNKAKSLGAIDYLIKSQLQPKEVVERIKQALGSN